MTGTDNRPDSEFIDKARQVFDDSVRGLDGATRSRLAQARAAAIEAAAGNRAEPWLAGIRLMPVGAVAALLAAVIWYGASAPVAIESPSMISDLDLLLEAEDLDLFDELEFYAWLSEQPEMADSDEEADGSG